MKIEKDTVVAFRYLMKNGEGELLEDRMGKEPVNFLYGSNAIQPILQQQMEGLTAGEQKIIYLNRCSGLTTDDFVFDVIIDDVRTAMEEEIMLGYPVKITTEKCDDDCGCYMKSIKK